MTAKWSTASRFVLGCVALAGGALMASCGGGNSTSTFRASRVVAFGDEMSLIVDLNSDGNGSKYSVNATAVDNITINCVANPIWIQVVANIYGLFYPQCNQGTIAGELPVSRIRAGVGAGSVDLGAQIDTQQAEGPLHSGDLVTVLIGENDVIAQYLLYPAVSVPQLTANVEAAGAEVGRQVNRLANTGARVLLATIPDVGFTPFAINEQLAHGGDTNRIALLSNLSQAFNTAMRTTIVNDGRKIGLVLLDELIDTIAANPFASGFSDVTEPVCNLTLSLLTPPSSLDCTAQTFVLNGNPTYLWADDRHLSANGQNVFGALAVTRAQNGSF